LNKIREKQNKMFSIQQVSFLKKKKNLKINTATKKKTGKVRERKRGGEREECKI